MDITRSGRTGTTRAPESTFTGDVLIGGYIGWARAEGEPIAEIRTGDLVWCPPGQRHWEGATPDHEMTCVAVQEEGGAGGVAFLA